MVNFQFSFTWQVHISSGQSSIDIFPLLIMFLLFCRTPQEQLRNILSNMSPHPSETTMEAQNSQSENDVDSDGQLSFN